MSLEYCDSFATYTTAQLSRRYSSSLGAAITSATLTGTRGDGYLVVPITARSEYFLGFDVYLSGLGQPLLDVKSASTTILSVSFNGSGALTTTFGNSAAGVVRTGSVMQFKIRVVVSGTVGIVTIYIDGVKVIDLSGLNTGTLNIASLVLYLVTYCGIAFSNFWVFNTLGSHSNGFPVGRMKVAALAPATDGTYSAWTPNSGTTHYNRVNQAQADDDTTYNAAITSGDKDSYGIGALSGSPAHIHGVMVTAIVRKDDVNSKTFQVFTKSGSTEAFSPDIAAPLNYLSSTTNGTAAILHGDDPNTSAEWTQTNVNALEVGVKVTL